MCSVRVNVTAVARVTLQLCEVEPVNGCSVLHGHSVESVRVPGP